MAAGLLAGSRAKQGPILADPCARSTMLLLAPGFTPPSTQNAQRCMHPACCAPAARRRCSRHDSHPADVAMPETATPLLFFPRHCHAPAPSLLLAAFSRQNAQCALWQHMRSPKCLLQVPAALAPHALAQDAVAPAAQVNTAAPAGATDAGFCKHAALSFCQLAACVSAASLLSLRAPPPGL